MEHWATICGAAVLFVAGYALVFKGLTEQLQLQDDVNGRLSNARKFMAIVLVVWNVAEISSPAEGTPSWRFPIG